MPKYKVGSRVKMTKDALENYGPEWEGVILEVTHVARNTKEHPGYDDGVKGQGLYDLRRVDNLSELQFSLYDWELTGY